jgi:hypothetical protein
VEPEQRFETGHRDLLPIRRPAQEDTDVGELKEVNPAIVAGLRGFLRF